MSQTNYSYDLNESISTQSKNFIPTLKDVAKSIGVGYEQIEDKIPHDRKEISFSELIRIAEKIKEENQINNSHSEINGATNNFIKLIKEACKPKFEFPF